MGLMGMADFLRDTGDLAGAEVAYQKALPIFRKIFPAESIGLFTPLNNFAGL